jgi:hypothetical protein
MAQTAAYEGYLEIVKFLISVGASTNITENKSRFVNFDTFKQNQSQLTKT